ncbi:MAG: hypothetical protein AAF329_23605, partial [Cyanobacteria bacterium P01_A01_bin.17]
MPGKQKVTFYLSDELHRQFKIRAAVDGETMSSMAQRAIEFYMNNAELVESSGHVHGGAHRIHHCPECNVAGAPHGRRPRRSLALAGLHQRAQRVS